MTTDWREEHHALRKEWNFESFGEALHFVNQVGVLAEQLGHHPDICIKDYNYVTISITTHEKGNILTEKDRKLARLIDAL